MIYYNVGIKPIYLVLEKEGKYLNYEEYLKKDKD